MNIITIDQNNLDEAHICCAIGSDKQNQKRAQTKKKWMKERFEEGLVFKRLDERGKVFIEYMPVEKVWKPIVGEAYLVINCLWVSGQFKGKGLSTLLLNTCIEDARAQNKAGVVVVSSSKVKPFLTDKQFFLKQGFVQVDTAPPYFELLALRLDDTRKHPMFSEHAKSGKGPQQADFTLIYSNQCPFMEEYVQRLSEVVKKSGMACHVHQLKSYQEAQEMGSPFGTLGIYFNGIFQTHELMPEKKFEQFVAGYKRNV